jgi:transketolase
MAPDISQRETYGQILVELGKENRDVVVLDADLCPSTMTKFFASEFPERTFDCGIAEQNMVSIAAGLAASGKIPFASTFAVFAPGRCFDQIRMSIAQPHLNVKLVTTHSGITVGEDGTSHQSLEDLALAGALPGFTIIAPADAIETAQVIRTATATSGPFYIRLCRPKLPLLHGDDYCFELGKAEVMRQGTQVTIMAIGTMVATALEAAKNLERAGVDCRVLNMSTLKPVDETAIIQAATDTGAIVTAEEHLEHGGLGSLVARVLVQKHPVPVELVAIKDTYAESGSPADLLEKYGLTAGDIERAVRSVIGRKKAG